MFSFLLVGLVNSHRCVRTETWHRSDVVNESSGEQTLVASDPHVEYQSSPPLLSLISV